MGENKTAIFSFFHNCYRNIKTLALPVIGMVFLAACHQYPMEYGDAKQKAHINPDRVSKLTTQASPLPWEQRSQWLESYVVNINFGIGSDKLDPLDRIRLKDYVESIDIYDPEFFVEGHADITGTPAFNRKLSQKRALRVREALVDAGIEPFQITIKSYGDRDPVATNLTVEGRKKNRRSIVIATPRIVK